MNATGSVSKKTFHSESIAKHPYLSLSSATSFPTFSVRARRARAMSCPFWRLRKKANCFSSSFVGNVISHLLKMRERKRKKGNVRENQRGINNGCYIICSSVYYSSLGGQRENTHSKMKCSSLCFSSRVIWARGLTKVGWRERTSLISVEPIVAVFSTSVVPSIERRGGKKTNLVNELLLILFLPKARS